MLAYLACILGCESYSRTVSQFPELTNAAGDDSLYIIDDSEASIALKSKKISALNLVGAVTTTEDTLSAFVAGGNTYILGKTLVVDSDGAPIIYYLTSEDGDEEDDWVRVGTAALTATQWGYLGAMNQDVATSDTPVFAGVTTPTITGDTVTITSGVNDIILSANVDVELNPVGDLIIQGFTVSTFGLMLIDDADAATARATLGINQTWTISDAASLDAAEAGSVDGDTWDQIATFTPTDGVATPTVAINWRGNGHTILGALQADLDGDLNPLIISELLFDPQSDVLADGSQHKIEDAIFYLYDVSFDGNDYAGNVITFRADDSPCYGEWHGGSAYEAAADVASTKSDSPSTHGAASRVYIYGVTAYNCGSGASDNVLTAHDLFGAFSYSATYYGGSSGNGPIIAADAPGDTPLEIYGGTVTGNTIIADRVEGVTFYASPISGSGAILLAGDNPKAIGNTVISTSNTGTGIELDEIYSDASSLVIQSNVIQGFSDSNATGIYIKSSSLTGGEDAYIGDNSIFDSDRGIDLRDGNVRLVGNRTYGITGFDVLQSGATIILDEGNHWAGGSFSGYTTDGYNLPFTYDSSANTTFNGDVTITPSSGNGFVWLNSSTSSGQVAIIGNGSTEINFRNNGSNQMALNGNSLLGIQGGSVYSCASLKLSAANSTTLPTYANRGDVGSGYGFQSASVPDIRVGGVSVAEWDASVHTLGLSLNHDGSQLGLLGATPVSQATTAIAESAFSENSGGTVVNVDSTFAGYTLQQVIEALQNYGLLQ